MLFDDEIEGDDDEYHDYGDYDDDEEEDEHYNDDYNDKGWDDEDDNNCGLIWALSLVAFNSGTGIIAGAVAITLF